MIDIALQVLVFKIWINWLKKMACEVQDKCTYSKDVSLSIPNRKAIEVGCVKEERNTEV